MNVKENIGKRIKQLREASKMSQKDLSYSADLDRSYIASVENGQRNISIMNIEKIIKALGVTFSEFFTNSLFDDDTAGT